MQTDTGLDRKYRSISQILLLVIPSFLSPFTVQFKTEREQRDSSKVKLVSNHQNKKRKGSKFCSGTPSKRNSYLVTLDPYQP